MYYFLDTRTEAGEKEMALGMRWEKTDRNNEKTNSRKMSAEFERERENIFISAEKDAEMKCLQSHGLWMS